MNCQKCGYPIPDKEVVCPHCGEEIQLVPDYNSVDYLVKRKKEKKDQERVMRDFQRSRKKRSFRWILWLLLLAVLVCGGILIAMWKIRLDAKRENSFPYQMRQAEEAYALGDRESAMEYLEKARSIDPANHDARQFAMRIYRDEGDVKALEGELLASLKEDGESAALYQELFGLYEDEGRMDEVESLYKAIKDETVRSQFVQYETSLPVFDPVPGEYGEEFAIVINCERGTVHYTTDGTEPDENSPAFTEEIPITEGRTEIRAVAINKKGFASEVVTAIYEVELLPPDPPVVSPASGSYSPGTMIEVAVPEGCTAYYAMDAIPDETYTPYSGPVAMQNGYHTFSVIAVDKNGKKSAPVSETYAIPSE